MNKEQRTRINTAQNALSSMASDVRRLLEEETKDVEKLHAAVLDLQSALEDAETTYNDIAFEEGEKYDNLSEGLQQSDRGQQYQENADTFQSAADDAATALQELAELIGSNEATMWGNDDNVEALSVICDTADELTSVDEA